MSRKSVEVPAGQRAPHILAGQAAEQAAAEFLAGQGLTVLARNVRVAPGEIDLIAREGATLVFCEVRWRAHGRFGGALASIGWRKRQRMERAAHAYLAGWRDPPPCRLDALCAEGPPPWAWIWLRGV